MESGVCKRNGFVRTLPVNMRTADNIYDLYRLGNTIADVNRIISSKQVNQVTYLDVYTEFTLLSSMIQSIIDDKVVPLDTCKSNARSLHDSLSEITREFLKEWREAADSDAKSAAWSKTIAGWRISGVTEGIKAFEYVFSAELAGAALYLVEQVGAYKTSILIDAADSVFPANIRSQLPPHAVNDIKAAGRCLAFELPTAAGFHIARAVETVLLKYFPALPMKVPRFRNLGRYIEALKKEGVKKGVDAKVLAALDQFRDLYRNPIMHPDAVLSIDEAQILFNLAQSAISAIILDIAKLAAKAVVASTKP